jgi:hypothetical protein
MKNYHFDDSDIEIDHKKEELEIIVCLKSIFPSQNLF